MDSKFEKHLHALFDTISQDTIDSASVATDVSSSFTTSMPSPYLLDTLFSNNFGILRYILNTKNRKNHDPAKKIIYELILSILKNKVYTLSNEIIIDIKNSSTSTFRSSDSSGVRCAAASVLLSIYEDKHCREIVGNPTQDLNSAVLDMLNGSKGTVKSCVLQLLGCFIKYFPELADNKRYLGYMVDIIKNNLKSNKDPAEVSGAFNGLDSAMFSVELDQDFISKLTESIWIVLNFKEELNRYGIPIGIDNLT